MYFLDLSGKRHKVGTNSYLEKTILLTDNEDKFLFFYVNDAEKNENSNDSFGDIFQNLFPDNESENKSYKVEISEKVFEKLRDKSKLKVKE